MGCDIHCYIEYRQKDADRWQDFSGRINPGRNYWMFGFMAGVRADFPHIEPRGRLKDLAYAARNDDWIWISDSVAEGSSNSDGQYYFSRKLAEEYISKGYAEGVPNHEGKICWVTNSDHHSHSWLTASEFELAIAGYLKQSGFQINTPQLPAPNEMQTMEVSKAEGEHDESAYALASIREYWPILSAMRCFEAQGCEARLVFWFDN